MSSRSKLRQQNPIWMLAELDLMLQAFGRIGYNKATIKCILSMAAKSSPVFSKEHNESLEAQFAFLDNHIQKMSRDDILFSLRIMEEMASRYSEFVREHADHRHIANTWVMEAYRLAQTARQMLGEPSLPGISYPLFQELPARLLAKN